MGSERRRYQRLIRPLEATFRGGSGATACRIGDISWGGCFVQTVASMHINERTQISLRTGENVLTLDGLVVYVEPGIGFAVQFDPLTPEHVRVLRDLLGNPDL